MTLHTDQMSDSFRIGAILAAVGGFLDAYTYLARGQVFANAQTGNIVLLGVHLSEGDFKKALSYLVPILAFVAGVFVDEWIKHRLEGKLALHWRQTVLLIEILALVVAIFLPLGKTDAFANALVSFICAMQVQSFRKFHGMPYATTMCTGNLRSGTDHLVKYFQTKDPSRREKSFHYYSTVSYTHLARNFPYLPYLMTMFLPHFSQMTSVTSSLISTFASFSTAFSTASWKPGRCV